MYEVQHFMLSGWENVWTHEQDGEYIPTFFHTYEEALLSLQEFFDDEREALSQGWVEDIPDEEDFRIVRV